MLYHTLSRPNPTEAVDTRRHNGGFRTVLLDGGVSVRVGISVLTPMEPSVRSLCRQGVPFGESNNKHRALLTNASNSESGETDRSSCGTNNIGTSPRLRRGVPGPGQGFGTPRRLHSDWSHTDSNGVLAWLGLAWLGLGLGLGVCKPKPQPKPDTLTPNEAKRSGAVPWDSFRLEPEGNVKSSTFSIGYPLRVVQHGDQQVSK